MQTFSNIWAAYQALPYSKQKRVRLTRVDVMAIKRALPDAQDIDRYAKRIADRHGLTQVQAVELLHELGMWMARNVVK